MRLQIKQLFAILVSTTLIVACQPKVDSEQSAAKAPETEVKTSYEIEFEKFTLDNGLEVVFHIDRSDPVTAVALTAHVGSSREVTGRTGFAHLFEHLLFLESENLGFGGLDEMSARIGGSGANGSTSRDRTNYFQTVPNDSLEKMIWAEADKLGWFINTVTQPVLEKEKQVVKNEKRQGVDNAPFGHNRYVIDKNLYPEGHPYSWQVIGSLDDLQAATLDDVKDFFKRWYVPNNVTLVIAGDFDAAQAKEWVHHYFDEIPRGPDITPLPKQPAVLAESKHQKYEDTFARQPQLSMVWPAAHLYHPDTYALDYLTELLADGEQSPFYKVLVEDEKLTQGVSMYSYESEIAGQLELVIRAYDDTDLDSVKAAIDKAFKKFEDDGISDTSMKRIRSKFEKSYYERISTALNKAFELAQYNIFADDPGFINERIKLLQAVTKEDVMAVYNKYVKGKNFVSSSVVPKGQTELALEGAVDAQIVEEKIVAGEAANFDLSQRASYEPTPSKIDRSAEPPYGKSPTMPSPVVWSEQTENAIRVSGIEDRELPLFALELKIKSGQLLESMDNLGISSLTAEMLNRGTVNRSKEQLKQDIELIGGSIEVSGNKTDIVISVSGLATRFSEIMDIMSEILLAPKFDEAEFTLLQTQTADSIKTRSTYPRVIAGNEFTKLLYGKDSPYAYDALGTLETVQSISLEQVKQFYGESLSPSNTSINVVGAVSSEEVMKSLAEIEKVWKTPKVALNVPEVKAESTDARLFFYNVPGAKQSQLRIGNISLPANDASYTDAQIANYKLGSAGFASRLTQTLRSEKGYTYGIRGGFFGNAYTGSYQISSGVRTNVTLESLQDIISIVGDYSTTFTEEDLANTQSFYTKSSARQFESLRAKLSLLNNISELGRSPDYIKQRNEKLMKMGVEDIAKLGQQYIDINNMMILVVGDAETQLERLKELSLGEPVLLN